MTWASVLAGLAKAVTAIFAWLGDKQLLDAGRAAAKGEGDAQARKDVGEIHRLRSDPDERARVRERLRAAEQGHPLRGDKKL